MLKVKAKSLELRGIANGMTKKGNAYYTINAEDPEDGTPYAFYCPNVTALPEGLKKGMTIDIDFNVRYYQGKERLEVARVMPSNKVG